MSPLPSPVAGRAVHIDNRYLAVWVREHGSWKFVARGRRENDVDETQLGHPALKQHADDWNMLAW
jgi:hypothetical protein